MRGRPCPGTRRRGVLLLAGVLSAAVLLAGCGGTSAGKAVAGGSETASSTGSAQVLTLHANNKLMFDKTALFAKAGSVTLTLVVEGSIPHNLTFQDGPGGGTDTVSNATTSKTLVFNKPGIYHFLCTIHPDQMTGTLTIQ